MATGMIGISIHPPLAGRDLALFGLMLVRGYFNPPAPCGAGQILCRMHKTQKIFQSTRPLRGGTAVRLGVDRRRWISIHPPLAGRDDYQLEELYPQLISIHPPLAGRDFDAFKSDADGRISIHPPLAGRDLPSPRGRG